MSLAVSYSPASFEVHPLAELIPPMSDAEYADLRADIEANGLRESVTLYEGKILDGRHRARACEETNTPLVTREYEGTEPIVFVLSMNVHRRHLTTAQRAEIARQVLPHLREEAKQRMVDGGRGGQVSTPLKAREQAGNLVGISGRTVAEMDTVARERPDLHEKVLTGEKGVREAWQETRAKGRRPSEPAARPVELGGRARINAMASRRRVETLVGTCQAFERALHEVRVEEAATVATAEEIAGWIKCLKAGERSLRNVRKRLEEPA